MVLDAALRDAEMREQVEQAYLEVERKKAEAAARAAKCVLLPFPKAFHVRMLTSLRRPMLTTTTPGSTLSEEYPELPHIAELDPTRYTSTATSEPDASPSRRVHSGQEPSSAEVDDEDEGTPVTANRRRKLIRPNERANVRFGSSASPEPVRSHRHSRESDADDSDDDDERQPANAFEAMKLAQERLVRQKTREEKRKLLGKQKKANAYLAEQASESEEEGAFAEMRRAAEGPDEDENSGSDDDGVLAELVDDAKVAADEQEEQDKLAAERFKVDMEADRAKHDKRVEKIAAGEERKRKMRDNLLDDSDYEDDEAGLHKKAKVKKNKTFDKKLEGLGKIDFGFRLSFRSRLMLMYLLFSCVWSYRVVREVRHGHRCRRGRHAVSAV